MRDHGAHIDNSAHSFMAWSRVVVMKKVKQNTLNSSFNGLTSTNNSKNDNNTHVSLSVQSWSISCTVYSYSWNSHFNRHPQEI